MSCQLVPLSEGAFLSRGIFWHCVQCRPCQHVGFIKHAGRLCCAQYWMGAMRAGNLLRLSALTSGQASETWREKALTAAGAFAERLQDAALALPQMCASLAPLTTGALPSSTFLTPPGHRMGLIPSETRGMLSIPGTGSFLQLSVMAIAVSWWWMSRCARDHVVAGNVFMSCLLPCLPSYCT